MVYFWPHRLSKPPVYWIFKTLLTQILLIFLHAKNKLIIDQEYSVYTRTLYHQDRFCDHLDVTQSLSICFISIFSLSEETSAVILISSCIFVRCRIASLYDLIISCKHYLSPPLQKYFFWSALVIKFAGKIFRNSCNLQYWVLKNV